MVSNTMGGLGSAREGPAVIAGLGATAAPLEYVTRIITLAQASRPITRRIDAISLEKRHRILWPLRSVELPPGGRLLWPDSAADDIGPKVVLSTNR